MTVTGGTQHVGRGGAWKQGVADGGQYIGRGGLWRRGFAEWVGVGGAWVRQWSAPLVPPAMVGATTVSHNTISVSYTPPSPLNLNPVANSYKIYWKAGSSMLGDPANADSSSGPPLGSPQQGSGFLPDTTYYFMWTAVRGSEESAPSAEDSTTTYVVPVTQAPTLTAADDATDDASILVSCTAVPEATNYELFASQTSGFTPGPGNKLGDFTAAQIVSSQVDHAVATGQTWYYKVRGTNSNPVTDGPFSNEGSATALPRVPGTPGAPVATKINVNRTDLSWAAGTPDTATTYRIQRDKRTCGAGFPGTWLDAEFTTGSTSYSDLTTQEGFAYRWRVRAENVSGNSAYSAASNEVESVDAPSAPSSVAATTTGVADPKSQIKVSWGAPTGTWDTVEIEYAVNGQAYGGTPQVTGLTTSPQTVTGLGDDTTYKFRMRTQECFTGPSGWSTPDATATTDPSPPGEPTLMSALPKAQTDDTLVVAWTPGVDATHVEIYGSTTTGFTPGPTNLLQTVAAPATSWEHTALGVNERWYYKLRSKRVGTTQTVFSAYTGQFQGNTYYTTPQSVSAANRAVDCPNRFFDITWSNTNGNGNSRDETMTLERDDGAGFNVVSSTVAAGTTAYYDTGGSTSTVGYRVKYNSETAYGTDSTVINECPE